ncbi:hypothetical protein J3R30DRAFT_1845667 [Lentinula aciculospora]|uniref:Uncharacterized protein n=1 Tax=Lentinula aciculospora TaxID=153920 RepID=A0A9W9DSZ4_9AGAR|nr:hypothetical protein J3R30DRAFT_1845667 [Lentinula aciculospora]
MAHLTTPLFKLIALQGNASSASTNSDVAIEPYGFKHYWDLCYKNHAIHVSFSAAPGGLARSMSNAECANVAGVVQLSGIDAIPPLQSPRSVLVSAFAVSTPQLYLYLYHHLRMLPQSPSLLPPPRYPFVLVLPLLLALHRHLPFLLLTTTTSQRWCVLARRFLNHTYKINTGSFKAIIKAGLNPTSTPNNPCGRSILFPFSPNLPAEPGDPGIILTKRTGHTGYSTCVNLYKLRRAWQTSSCLALCW